MDDRSGRGEGRDGPAPRRARPPSLFREELRRAWRELRGPSLSPARGAMAVALGLFIGSIPVFGLHTPLVLVLCVWFQLDAAIAWVASNISNPFFAPFLVTAEVQVGAYLRTGRFLGDFEPSRIADFVGYAFLGAPLVALVIAVAGFAVTFASIHVKRAFVAPAPERAAYRLPANAPPFWHAVERVAARYAPPAISSTAERTRFHYVRIKLLGDPVARLVADGAGEHPGALGDVLDIGCGRGQLGVLLLELDRAKTLRGFDWDAAKVELANRAAQREPALPVGFEADDVRLAPFEAADTVLLIDVLHYLQRDEQDALLARAAAAVRPGGRLLVREADTARGLRSWLTLAEEKLFTLLRFNRGARVCFRPTRELVAVLEGAGLRCEAIPAWGRTPFANVLVIAHRPTEPGATRSGQPSHGAVSYYPGGMSPRGAAR